MFEKIKKFIAIIIPYADNLRLLWLACFLYTAAVALLIQFVLVPVFLPRWHAVDGLLASSLDSYAFHKIAMQMADKIHAQGWSVWQLRPMKSAPSGIAAAIYAFTSIYKPAMLIPLNAALHASAAVILLLIVQVFISQRSKALCCILPFLLYPSAANWYSQIHKDGFSILGSFFIIYSFLLLIRLGFRRSVGYSVKMFLSSTLFVIAGFFLIWLVREYLFKITLGVTALIYFLLAIFFLIKYIRHMWSSKFYLEIIALIFIFSFLLFFLIDELNLINNFTRVSPTVNSIVGDKANKNVTTDKTVQRISTIEDSWKRTSWLPIGVDENFRMLARMRLGFRFTEPNAKSNIDTQVGFDSASSVLRYLPRAAEIVFLLPGPRDWFSQGSSEANTFMRKVSGLEMLGVYFALIFLIYALWYWRKRIEIWAIFIFCSLLMLIYGLAVCNVATLYRMRYGYMMTLVALGVAGFIAALEQFKKKGSREIPSGEKIED